MSAEVRPIPVAPAEPAGGRARPVVPARPAESAAPSRNEAMAAATQGVWPVILWTTIPFWLAMTATRVLGYAVRVAAIPDVQIAEPLERTLQHVILFFILITFYRIALAIGWPERNRWLAALGHLALATTFACLATPVLTLSIDLTEPQLKWLPTMLAGEGAVQEQISEWVRSGILLVSIPDFFISYWFGLILILGVRTYLDLRNHRLRLAQLEHENLRARLHALRMQLHPHFLFNTLHSVSGLIDTRPAVARQIIVRLGDLLRRTLRDSGADLVPLGRELDFVRNYLEIQQLRFPDRLRFTVRVDTAVQDAMVPSLILQPLAENAVVHGAGEDEERVAVSIEARQVIDSRHLERWLELTVHNTGSRDNEGEGSGAHIGTGNTRERLQALYGSNFKFEFGAPPEGGFLVLLRIPFREGVVE
jgi:Histidine kinase